MGTFRTFAYGSTMDLDDFQDYCKRKSCRYYPISIEGKATLKGFELKFDHYSKGRESGAANIVEKPGDYVEGLILIIDDRLQKCLRMKEGYNVGIYNEMNVTVEKGDGSTELIMTYQVIKEKRKPEHQKPSEYYMGVILKAANDYDFSKEYIKKLKAFPVQERKRMTLNPIQFGKEVVDQFGRYLMTTFPIADEKMSAQLKGYLEHGVGGERYLAKGPYVYLNRPFEEGPSLEELLADKTLKLHSGIKKVFPFEKLHKHQELGIRAICKGKNVIISTGTGSGKTEAFLLPIVDECLKMRDDGQENGVVAVLVYPMNALVNDQLRRLRPLLAGTKVTFGRYTGETPSESSDAVKKLETARAYTKEEFEEYEKNPEDVPHPWEECISKDETRERKPRILLTNYKQLEYLLLRDKDLELFKKAPIKFLVFDEVHTYTGILGSEVACLIRRLKNIAGGQILSIGTSATVAPDDAHGISAEKVTRTFAARLFGVKEEDIDLITERHKKIVAPSKEMYIPKPPANPRALMDKILDETKEIHLQDEVLDIPESLLALAEQLCGKKADKGDTNLEKLYWLLTYNRLIYTMGQLFTTPILFEKALPRLYSIGPRASMKDEDLAAEIISYLTLGAIAHHDGEVVLRPKLHYFVQGLQGLWVSPQDREWKVHFNLEKAQKETEHVVLPLLLCRGCGQHYFKVLAPSAEQAVDIGGKAIGCRTVRIPKEDDHPGAGESEFYLTDHLTSEEDDDGEVKGTVYHMCRFCGALHSEEVDTCQNAGCSRKMQELKVMAWEGELTQCRACTAVKRGDSPPVRITKSGDVSDITILAQSMLSAMPDKALQKILIFADNRQDAAYQAGWMEERSKRFRLRHLLFRILASGEKETWRFDKLVERLLEDAINEEILPRKSFENEDEKMQVRWFILEEFATTQQRRSSIENLGLARVEYEKLDVEADKEFYDEWSRRFGIKSQDLVNIVRVILDYYRRRGALSDSLLQRKWGFTDREARDGIITVSEHFKPQVIIPETTTDKKVIPYRKTWLTATKASPAQHIMHKSIAQGEDQVDAFLKVLWSWLKEHEYLKPAKLIYKMHGKFNEIQIPGEKVQVNIEKVGIAPATDRHFCKACRKAQSVPIPESICPEYNCKGKTKLLPIDQDNYDVVRYTRLNFVPLKTYEHSAQVPKEKREEVEQEFKREGGKYNCIVCTPTLELGVDIGKLESLLMRNVPPTPANYSQRSGRAGRRHRIAVVMTYCRAAQHDRYFFNDPTAMISGEIRVPAFSMHNEPLIRKHIHSSTLTALRELTTKEEKELLGKTFPPFIWAYFGVKTGMEEGGTEPRLRYFQEPIKFEEYAKLLKKYEKTLNERLKATFKDTWPEKEKGIVSDERLSKMLDEMPLRLATHTNRLFHQIATYNAILKRYSKLKYVDGVDLTEEEEYERKRFENAIKTFKKEDSNNYSLTYLSDDGFLPGYALSRESCLAQCFDPYQELTRPASVALREFTPANWLYANKNIFKVQKLNFYKFSQDSTTVASEQLTQRMIYDAHGSRVIDEGTITTEGGDESYTRFESFELTDIELRKVQNIDDRSDMRRRIAFDIYGLLLNQHNGGHAGKINQMKYQYLNLEKIRLVNLGPKARISRKQELGFPICPKCGETRSPFASPAEIDKFNEVHKDRCKVEKISWSAIHIETRSDILMVGPYDEHQKAVNVMEGVRIGARHILDMTSMDVDCFVSTDDSLNYWAVIYDPMPGGSGFIPQILAYWPHIVEASINALNKCQCKTSCYTCLLHFRNQQYHDVLNRHNAIELLNELQETPEMETPIPPATIQQKPDTGMADSPGEVDIIKILQANHFPMPDRDHYLVNLGGGTRMEADYAYTDAKVLIFIDGMSRKLHGDPKKRAKDIRDRSKAEMQGYHVVETSHEGLKDQTNINAVLFKIATYLGRDDLAQD